MHKRLNRIAAAVISSNTSPLREDVIASYLRQPSPCFQPRPPAVTIKPLGTLARRTMKDYLITIQHDETNIRELDKVKKWRNKLYGKWREQCLKSSWHTAAAAWLVGSVSTVLIAITFPAARNTSAIVASELGWMAGCGSYCCDWCWKQSHGCILKKYKHDSPPIMSMLQYLAYFSRSNILIRLFLFGERERKRGEGG